MPGLQFHKLDLHTYTPTSKCYLDKTHTSDQIVQAAIDWFKELGYNYAFGPEIAFDNSIHMPVSLLDGMSLSVLGRREVRMKYVEVQS